MKAVNAVSALSSAQVAAGAQPAAGSFRRAGSGADNGAAPVMGFAGQLASLASTQAKGSATAPTEPVSSENRPPENAQVQQPVQDDAQDPQAESDAQREPHQAVLDTTESELVDAPQAEPAETAGMAASGKELPAASALTELVRSYLSAGRGTQAAETSVASSSGQPQSVTGRADAAGAPSASQEYQRLLATMEQRLSPAELRGLDTARADALKAAMQSGGSSSAANIGAQSLLDSRPDLLTGSQRNPTVSEWAPIKVANQQTHHWGRDLMAALGDRLSMQINQNVKEARIRLDPPELGRIEMTVRLDGDRLNVQLNASNHQVRDMLSQHADRLRMDLIAQNTQSVDVHVGQGHERRDSRPAYAGEEAIASGLAAEESSDSNSTERHRESWLSTKA